jgi:hypothetical protein
VLVMGILELERGEEMKHFSIEEWADFARGVAARDRQTDMQEHLETGCKRCVSAVSLWKRVHQAAQREAGYEPPEATLRTVKGLYAIHAKPAMRADKAGFAELLFDSFRAPLEAGVRSSTTDVRQLLYGSGDHRIDLRLEPQADSDKISLLGQLLNSTDPASTTSAVPVTLLRGRKVVAESATNRFGEFHFEVELEENLQLRVSPPQGPEFSVALVYPTGQGEAGGRLQPADSKGVKKLLRGRKKSTRKKV